MEKLEIAITIFGILQSILVMLNKRSNWLAYSMQMFLMIIFSFSMHLYGDLVNNMIYFVIGIIGYILWNRKKYSNIKKCSIKERFIYVFIILLSTLIVYLLLKNTNDPLPFLDAFTTTTSFVATYYMLVKKIDTWIIWFINDVFYAIEYFILPDQALYLFLMNVLWTFMAILSYYNWSRLMKEMK